MEFVMVLFELSPFKLISSRTEIINRDHLFKGKEQCLHFKAYKNWIFLLPNNI